MISAATSKRFSLQQLLFIISLIENPILGIIKEEMRGKGIGIGDCYQLIIKSRHEK